MSRPLAVAITGGIGAGKSEALAAFGRQGAATVSSDEIVHRLLREDEGVRKALLDRFGDRILDEAGQLDRSAIAEIVFPEPEALQSLEQLLHPLVAREYLDWREALAGLRNPPAVCATEVPLLYEVGADERFDAVVLITAPAQLRIARTDVPVEQRSDRLIPDEEKAKRADFVYRNTGSLEDLDGFVSSVLDNLRRWS